jgi:hypothetical protein
MLPAFGIAVFAWTPGPLELCIAGVVFGIATIVVVVFLALRVHSGPGQGGSAVNPNLVPCPECGRLISRAASACPGCGPPMTPTPGV